MGVVIIDTLQRGGTGAATFPVIQESDSKVSYLTVNDIPARDAIEEWKRLPFMKVHVISDGKDYRLGSDITIANQVWTEVLGGTGFQPVSEKNQPGGYVGLELDGFINPQFIKAIYANTSYVRDDIGSGDSNIGAALQATAAARDGDGNCQGRLRF